MSKMIKMFLSLTLSVSLLSACSPEKKKSGKKSPTRVKTRTARNTPDVDSQGRVLTPGQQNPNHNTGENPDLVDSRNGRIESGTDDQQQDPYLKSQNQNGENPFARYNGRPRLSEAHEGREGDGIENGSTIGRRPVIGDGSDKRSSGYSPRVTVEFVPRGQDDSAAATPTGDTNPAAQDNGATTSVEPIDRSRPAFFNELEFDRNSVVDFFLNLPNRKRNVIQSVLETSKFDSSKSTCTRVYNDAQTADYWICDPLFEPEKAVKLADRYVEKRGLDSREFREFQEITYYLADIREHLNDEIFVFEIWDGRLENFLQDLTGNEENMGAVNLAAKFTKKTTDKWDFETFKYMYECVDRMELDYYGSNGRLKDRRAATDQAFKLMKKYIDNETVSDRFSACLN